MQITTTLLCFLALAAHVHARPTPVFTLVRPTVDVHDFAEITLRQPAFKVGNPFTDLTLTGVFVGADGDSVRVQGFCDAPDGSLFRLRFMPRKPGLYRFAVAGQFSGGLAGRKPLAFVGTVTAVPGHRRGMVQTDKNHPAHFVYDGTDEHYFWNSTTAYWLMGWRDEATIRAAIDRLAALKINRMRVVINGRQDDGSRWAEPLVKESAGFTFKLNPWPAADSGSLDAPGFDVSRFNVSHWQRMDRMLGYARDRGINVSVIFYVDGLEHGSDPFKKSNMGGPDEQRYYQYAVNRFAGFANVMWDVANEYYLFRSEAWAEAMGTFLRRADPYDHLTSIHGNSDFPFRASPWVDFLMVQSWDECGGYYAMRQDADRQAKTGFVKPQINEEYGYEDHYPEWGCGKRTAPARNAQNRARIAWEICMAGAYQTTGERADRGTGAGPDTGGGWINGRGDSTMILLKYHAILQDVFTSVDWWRMTPRPELTHHGTLCLTTPDSRQYLLYVQSGTPTLFVPKQTYSVRTVDIWTGQARNLPDFGGGHWMGPQALGNDVAVIFEQKK